MLFEEIKNNVEKLKAEISGGNLFGEPVALVAATKMQTADAVNAAIEAGVDAVAENKVQEFKEKTEFLLPCPQHFIGHLQTNKVKYLIGHIELFHSCDRDALAEEIAARSLQKGIESEVLIQVNIGNEETKGGYRMEDAFDAFLRLRKTDGLKVRGFMAMLPESDDAGLLSRLSDEMRRLFERAREKDEEIKYLSMGMSGDYRLCIEHGSNMIRVGSTLFGKRNYAVQPK